MEFNDYLVIGMFLTFIALLFTGFPIAWVLGGGAAYTVGVFFYLQKGRPWMHALWHLFVMAGAGLHGVAVFLLLARS